MSVLADHLPPPPYPNMDSSKEDWLRYKQWEVDHLNALKGHSFQQFLFLIFILRCRDDYIQMFQIGQESRVEDFLTDMTHDNNKIHNLFNQMKDADPATQKKLAKQALNIFFNEMKPELDKAVAQGMVDKDFALNITQQYISVQKDDGQGPIFGSDVHGTTDQDVDAVTARWNKAWHPKYPVPPKPSPDSNDQVNDGDDEPDTTQINVITTAFDDVSSSLGNQNSVVQTQVKWHTTMSQILESTIHNCVKDWVEPIRHSMSAQTPA